MVYLLNTELPEKKNITIALQNIFGIGKAQAKKICNFLGLCNKTKIQELPTELKNKIILFIEKKNIIINNELKQMLIQTKENQIRIKCYKGQRAKYNLPRRGQRTHTNAQTVKKFK